MQRAVWWIALTLFSLTIAFGLFLMTASVAANPEAAAFILGLLGFWLFANRLIFGYGAISNTAEKVIEGEDVNKEEIAEKVAKSPEAAKAQKLEELEAAALLSMWYGVLEPFKYAYYLGFFLLFLVAALCELNILSSVIFGPVVEAVTLGAAVPTLLVWSLEWLARQQVSSALEKLLSKNA
ncbi:MAG: hypothetical protein ABGX12_04045 [Desulfurobacteriaceae bacterium]